MPVAAPADLIRPSWESLPPAACSDPGGEAADLAASAGIEAFCYWHYWFSGRRLLERPFEEVVR